MLLHLASHVTNLAPGRPIDLRGSFLVGRNGVGGAPAAHQMYFARTWKSPRPPRVNG